MFSIAICRTALCAMIAAPFTFANPVHADVVSVSDHSLSDWGIGFDKNDVLTVPTGVTANPNFYNKINNYSDSYSTDLAKVGNSSLSPTATFNGFTFWYNYEDDTDNTLGPHTGGQDFDGEFLGVGVSGAYLAIAIVTGQRPDNPFANFSPGDLRIVTSLGTFGVELTGSTFNLNSSGYTTSKTSSPFAAGTVVQTSSSDWKTPPTGLPPATPVQLKGGTQVGDVLDSTEFYAAGSSLTYGKETTTSSYNRWTRKTTYTTTVTQTPSQHTFYELLIPLSYFGVSTITSVHWAPSCGNDLLDVNGNISTGVPTSGSVVPEPGSLALAGFAGIGLALQALRRRRTQKSDQAA